MTDDARGSHISSPKGIDRPKNHDGIENRASKLIGERDLTIISKPGRTQSAQTMNELAALTLSPQGRNQIQEMIDSQHAKSSSQETSDLSFTPKKTKENVEQQPKSEKAKVGTSEDFYSKCASILEKKAITLSSDFQTYLADFQVFFGRSMEVDDVMDQWGQEVTRAFGVARGMIKEEKSEQVKYSEAFHKTFSKEYFTEATWVSGSRFRVNSYSDKFGNCESVINLAEGSIDVNDCVVKKKPGALHLSQFAGEQWLYVLSKIKDGEDDNGTKIYIDPSKSSKYIFRELSHSMITNAEFKSTIRQLVLRGRRKGAIDITKDTPQGTEDFLIVEGTPSGSAAPFLPREYNHVFGDIECSNIKLDLDGDSSSSVNIDKIRFRYDPKKVSE